MLWMEVLTFFFPCEIVDIPSYQLSFQTCHRSNDDGKEIMCKWWMHEHFRSVCTMCNISMPTRAHTINRTEVLWNIFCTQRMAYSKMNKRASCDRLSWHNSSKTTSNLSGLCRYMIAIVGMIHHKYYPLITTINREIPFVAIEKILPCPPFIKCPANEWLYGSVMWIVTPFNSETVSEQNHKISSKTTTMQIPYL